jgi:hypothetical protein
MLPSVTLPGPEPHASRPAPTFDSIVKEPARAAMQTARRTPHAQNTRRLNFSGASSCPPSPTPKTIRQNRALSNYRLPIRDTSLFIPLCL